MSYEPVIGLEIHVQLKTKTKMFCDSKNDPDEKHSNINICPVCLGHPGTLPTINLEAVKKTILLGLALNCKTAGYTFFERKNYFYPDLPKGYQITQYQAPLCTDGYLDLPAQAGINSRKIRIRRVHLEEDTGRLLHDPEGKFSLIDFNRAGIPLLELVTEPDLSSGEEVRKFGEELQLILRYLGISDADMQKGQMRVEVNISLTSQNDPTGCPAGQQKLGSKVELKNINSFKFAAQAVDYEIQRQSGLLKEGKKIVQETRGWDETKQKTFSQRTKEEAQDYRYLPEPDLPPIRITNGPASPKQSEGGPPTDEIDLEKIRVRLVELPSQRRERFKKQYNLPEHDIEVFTINKQLGDYFEKVFSELKEWNKLIHFKKPLPQDEGKPVKLAANYLITELSKLLYERGTGLEEMEHLKITPENFAEFIARIFHQEISSSGAQILLKEMFETGEDPSVIIEKKDLAQISDAEELVVAAKEVIAENPKPVKDYKKGKKESLQFLVGQVMKKTKGKANPQVAREIIEKELRE